LFVEPIKGKNSLIIIGLITPDVKFKLMDGIYPYLVLFVVWMVYFAGHSLLAADITKKSVKEKFPSFFPAYRISFNLISIFGLGAILYYQWSLPELSLMTASCWTLFVGAVFILAGLIIAGIAFSGFNKSEFLGWQQLKGDKATKKEKLVTSGLYGIVRHPLYFSLILIMIGYVIYSCHLSNLIFALCTFIYLPIGTILEENKLINVFGKEYLDYKSRVSMLIPFLF
jgi:protein-S-isoprenylcysteine O-methyltransferase Ste14